MFKRILVFSLFIIFAIPVLACLNISGHNLDGEWTDLEMVPFLTEPNRYPESNQIRSELSDLKLALEDAFADTLRDQIHCDIAAYMILEGRVEAARDYLYKNVKQKVDNYNYAANLGVAHELLGNLDSAYYWTKTGTEINPDSHHQSEWIHVRILEIKLALEENPNWWEENTIFGFEIPEGKLPIEMDVIEDLEDPDLFYEQLYFQLNERTFFVKPDGGNPIIGRSLLLLADIGSRLYDVEEPVETYALAMYYDSTLVEVCEKRLVHLEERLLQIEIEEKEREMQRMEQEIHLYEATAQKNRLWLYVGIGIFVLLLVIGIALTLRTRR